MSISLDQSTVLVTGANRGLGKAFAEALVAAGATVYAGARDPRSVTTPGVTAVRLDVTDPASVAAAAAELGDVTVVVNNAGIGRSGSLLSGESLDGFREELETNVIGPLHVTRAFAPILAANGGGAVVNIHSALSWFTSPQVAGYSATKAALWSLTNAARGELRDQGTLVVGVHVGYMDTDMTADVTAPKSDPADLVTQVLDALEKGEEEVLGDETSQVAKSVLSGPPAHLVL
ncbi:short-chain dehydrogenase [Nocardioides sp. Root1257]|uniref:SDR family oxidoreductase n=1 Tax=unclassified Nocardioides TaxID=2615069 RepID=UPI0006FD24C1|nr:MULTISPECIES: SDR family oxidoreductase [unclassified Nocardioides]KQW45115.1 short-chain dehydrogenase [Nocardioides sp. Root1257]KRC45881.1 short-chain dehydrogenase [Nocardioides sp. Root224]